MGTTLRNRKVCQKESNGLKLLAIEELLAGAEVKYPKTLAPQATFKKAAAKKKAPKASDKGHPEAMFDDGLLK